MAKLDNLLALLFLTSLSLQITIGEDAITDDELIKDELISDKKFDSQEDAYQYQDAGEVPEEVEVEEAEGSGDLPEIKLRGDNNEPKLAEEKLAEEKLPEVQPDEEESAKSQCQQVNSAEGVLIDCQGQKLEAVLKDLDASVAVLDLSNNAISELTSSAFPEKLDTLKNLTLQNNAIKSIDKNAFNSLPHVESIDLSGNELTVLDPETFSGLSALSDLNLGRNSLNLPSAALFLNVPALRRLSMVDCGLQQLPENTFDGMVSLEELDLGGNPIADETPIVPSVFAALTNLSSLTLPKGASPALIIEVCRSHGLLPNVCVGSCVLQTIPCHTPPPPVFPAPVLTGVFVARVNVPPPHHEMDPAGEEEPPAVTGESATEKPATVLPGMKSGARDTADTLTEESIPASTRVEVSGAGVNKTIIGLVIGGLLTAVAAVVVKKNWSKIRGKRDEERRSGVGAQPPPRQLETRSPEEIPLQNKAQV